MFLRVSLALVDCIVTDRTTTVSVLAMVWLGFKRNDDGELQLWLSELEVFAVLLSALIHDFEHTGTTNAYHVNTRHVHSASVADYYAKFLNYPIHGIKFI